MPVIRRPRSAYVVSTPLTPLESSERRDCFGRRTRRIDGFAELIGGGGAICYRRRRGREWRGALRLRRRRGGLPLVRARLPICLLVLLPWAMALLITIPWLPPC
jgi:hypothetical protein